MYLNLYIGLSLALTLFGVLMAILAIRKRNPREASHANILPLLSGIPDDEKEEKDDTLSDS